MKVSVVIPTHNRRDLLRQAILSLEKQSYPVEKYEVIIIDDGSDDGTEEMVHSLQSPFPLCYLWQDNRGRASARNLGARQAQGELILFLDADMEASPRLLEAHVGSHRKYPNVLVMGTVLLASSVARTPFAMLAGSNRLDMDSDAFLSPLYCTTGNLSVEREAFRRIGGFDERFQVYGWEDTDFGYRATTAGLRLLYNPRALSYHHDYAVNARVAGERMRRAALSVGPLFEKHPELEGQLAMFQDKGYIAWRDDPPHIILRKLARSVIILPPALWALETVTKAVEALYPSAVLLRPLYRWVIGTYICLGYREGLKTRYG